MALLTDLPAEILLQILAEALRTERDAPACPSESQDRTRLKLSRGVWIQNEGLGAPPLPLLLVNRLINRHVQAIAAKEKNYALDVMFVKMAGIWPTWTRIPVLTRHVDTVHATFRIFNPAPDLDSRFDKSGSLGYGCGGREHGVWNFYYLLTSFLEGGPRARSASQRGMASCQYTVKNLIIDVLAPPEDEDHAITGPGPRSTWQGRQTIETFSLRTPKGWRGPPSLEPRVEPAEKLALFIREWISAYLCMSLETDYSMILYEGLLDSVEIRVDGGTRWRIDVDDALRAADPRNWSTSEGAAQRERWRAWKEWVTEKRRLLKLGREMPRERPHNYIKHEPYMFVNEGPCA